MSNLRFALPSTGALFDGTSDLLTGCGLSVRRANSRRYTADIPSLPGVDVLFQRQSDITIELDGGSADIGIAGFDRYSESRLERGDTVVVHDGLGFGSAKLVIAVPDYHRIDISHVNSDLLTAVTDKPRLISLISEITVGPSTKLISLS